ncbi:zinc finger protein PLAGL2 isoform X1 [Mixophyes fleayi]|uniref:zinc finger protein PLAGL2 isoform X1 n=2 Tax=Mixophyes fleayi TaxID=3061075 RepID=UPI003F4DD750
MKTHFFHAAKNEDSTVWKEDAKAQGEEDLSQRKILQDTTRLDVPCTSEQESPPHRDQRRFTCPQLLCDKTFASKYKLCRHMATHSMQKSHQCSHCGKMFHRKDHLKNHLQTHNPNRVALQCPECSKNYSTKYGHRRHLALHAIARGDLSCTICLQVFRDRQSVLEHLKSHNHRPSVGNREKKYPCEHCDRCFYTRKDVRRHLVVHTGRKDFQCHCCAQMFGRKDHLTRHIKKSHCEEGPRIKMEPPDELSHMSCRSAVVKEEFGSIMCMQPRDMIPGGMYTNPFQPMPNPGIAHSLVPSSLSLGFNYPTESTPSFSTDQSNRFQYTSTSYLPKSEMDPFMSDGSGGLCLSSSELSSYTPQATFDETFLSTLCDPLSSGVDFSHFLSFLPVNLPPCNIPVSAPEMTMGENQQFLSSLSHMQTPTSSIVGDLPHFTSDINSTTLPQFHQAFK